MTPFLGHNYIGGQRSANGSIKLQSIDATTGEALPRISTRPPPRKWTPPPRPRPRRTRPIAP